MASKDEGAPAPVTIETAHEAIIHDVQLDYYSKRLATCSSDRTIKIFDVDDPSTPRATLTGHEGPVWQIAWAHPKFGVLLASCSYDTQVIIHKEDGSGNWSPIHSARHHESSVNSIAWAPHQQGLWLACASSDGHVSFLRYGGESNQWSVQKIQAGGMSCNSVSWAPFGHLGSSVGQASMSRIVTGGCDNLVKIWCFDSSANQWKNEKTITCHDDWVRDVAWAPNTGMLCNTIASCSEDGTVYMHTQRTAGSDWTSTKLHSFDAPVWRVSWSVTGNLLAVSAGDSDVTLWKENLDGQWKQISTVDSNGVHEQPDATHG